MHVYIYDSFVSQNKYASLIAKIETRITDLGLNGKIIRLGPMVDAYESIQNEARKGAKTITVVGNDKILNQAVDAMASLIKVDHSYNNLPIALIQIGNEFSNFANYFGIGKELEACNILAARLIARFSLGLANQHYFLKDARINSLGTIMEIDGSFSMESQSSGEIAIVNLPIDKNFTQMCLGKKDGLQLIVKTKEKKGLLKKEEFGASNIYFKHLIIKNKSESLLLDSNINISTPVEIYLAQEKISLIVGKDRE